MTHTVNQQTHTSRILRHAADALEALPHPRVNAVDLHQALLKSAPAFQQAKDALDALHAYLRTLDQDVRWLHVGGGPLSRVLAADRLRAAAEYADEAVAGVR